MRFALGLAFSLCFALTLGASQLRSQEVAKADYEAVVSKAIAYLKTQGQSEDGSFSGKAGIGPTAVVVTALLDHGVSVSDPVVLKGLAFIEKQVRPDGGIFPENSRLKNYETSIAVVCLAKANKNGKYDNILKNAERYLKELQWDEGEGKNPSDLEYGGAGYDSKGRPDLSNTSFFVEALHSLGKGEDDPAIQKALQFISRCQNLESEQNNSPQAAKVNDGGFFYTIAGGGESKAGDGANGGLRSYGSMTYAGLKSMIYAGVDKSDKRVVAAVEFLKKYYDLDTNPGMGSSGLFYYYQMMGKALEAYGEPEITDATGKPHVWRAELFAKLKATQQANGSWVNTDSRWMEGDPNLVTGFALLALHRVK